MTNEFEHDVESGINLEGIIPNIEKDQPIPKSQKEAMEELSPQAELEVRTNTIKTLSELTGDSLEANINQKKDAEAIATKMMQDPKYKPDYGQYPNETMAYLAGMVAQTNCMIVEELADFKLHIVNRLLQEAETGKTARDRISALSKLGEIDGVDAFKKKTEITHINKSHEEIEKELLETIAKLEGKVIEGEIIEDDDNEE
jgi:hypothetical protein